MTTETDTTIPIHDPLSGIKALLDERDGCEARAKQIREQCDDRVKQINEELQKARGLIDGRSLGVPRKPRKPRAAAASDNPEPPEAA